MYILPVLLNQNAIYILKRYIFIETFPHFRKIMGNYRWKTAE